ncbi:hypothetical protein CPC08DRAFT_703663 [Agrocybe pediades]|nr:hypothetical protein CPC08DRAFT_703663 [Agrocybe pediades]
MWKLPLLRVLSDRAHGYVRPKKTFEPNDGFSTPLTSCFPNIRFPQYAKAASSCSIEQSSRGQSLEACRECRIRD